MTAHAINGSSNPVELCVAGMAAQDAGQSDVAIAHFEAALALAPRLLDVRLLLAYALGADGRATDGRTLLDGTPECASLNLADTRRLADAAIELEATPLALHLVRRVLDESPDDAPLQATHGALLQRAGRIDDASLVLQRAHLRWPTNVPVLVNRARVLVEQGAYMEGAALYNSACSLDPRNDAARWSRGLLRLMMGDVAAGWRDHEARRTQRVHQVAVPRGLKAWSGRQPNGVTLLLWGEQGLGDQIQGVRFAATLASLGARVIVRCHRSLVRLFAGAPGVSLAVADGDPIPACDAHVPMLSVPALLGMQDEGDYGDSPYLAPTGQPSAALSAQLRLLAQGTASSHLPRVGFVWAGSPGHVNDHNRSLPASQLASLLRGSPVQWVPLQVGSRVKELAALPADVSGTVHHLGTELADFADTAHVLRALDLVLTVDTSMAHLAGAMGVSTLLLLPFVPDWRWQIAREDSPWYGSVRVLRQPSIGNWEAMIAQAHRALAVGGFARAA